MRPWVNMFIFVIHQDKYHSLTELWLRNCFPVCLFINTNLWDKIDRKLKSHEELNEHPHDSKDISKK